jgi:raffinose/stachyose/melibiose transport system permease protein
VAEDRPVHRPAVALCASSYRSGRPGRSLQLYDWDSLALTDYIGLGNYRHRRSRVPRGDGHNAILIALSLGLQLPLASAALLLNRPLRGRRLLRLVFFAPYVISEAVTAIVFLQILQPDNLVDSALRAVGLGGLVHLWLADLGLVFYTLFVVITWKYIGFAIILFLAGLQGIPRELNEAAAMDGATSWSTLRYITIPMLGPTIRIWATSRSSVDRCSTSSGS